MTTTYDEAADQMAKIHCILCIVDGVGMDGLLRVFNMDILRRRLFVNGFVFENMRALDSHFLYRQFLIKQF